MATYKNNGELSKQALDALKYGEIRTEKVQETLPSYKVTVDVYRIFAKKYSGGSYTNARLIDRTHHVDAIMERNGFKVIAKGNNAPRGGRQGDYVEVTYEAYEFINGLISQAKGNG